MVKVERGDVPCLDLVDLPGLVRLPKEKVRGVGKPLGDGRFGVWSILVCGLGMEMAHMRLFVEDKIHAFCRKDHS